MEYQQFWLPMRDQVVRNVHTKISKGGTFRISSNAGDFWIDEQLFLDDLLALFTNQDRYRVTKKESGTILIKKYD